MELAVLVLVIATLVLVGFSLYMFITKESNLKKMISVPGEIEEAYVAEENINFYLAQGGSKNELSELFGVKEENDYYVVEKQGEGVYVKYKFKIS